MENREYIYVAALSFSVILCMIIFATTAFYSLYYPTTGVISLSRDVVSIALSIFNGYSENIPTNQNPSLTSATIAHIQALSLHFVGIIVFEILLATIVMIIFDLMYRNYGRGKDTRDKYVNKELFITFFLALLSSQYIEASFYFLTRGIPYSGISLFEVDATVTSIVFLSLTAIIVMSRAIRISILKRPKPTAQHVIEAVIFIAYILFVEAVTVSVLLPELDVTFNLTQFGGLSIASYGAHWSAIVLFSIFFVMFYSYLKLILPAAMEAGRRRYAQPK